ncbi:MAG: TIR domain-containing protein, partial [Clostridia bacterium]|nr:TIR domain-containing protein [Clostridia bacterium]
MEVFDVFISYRRKDGGETARALFNYLKKRGLRPFLDIAGIPDGKYFNEVIADKLKAAPHYVLIGSADAFALREDEDWVREEMILATDEKEKNSDERTVTVIVPDGVTVPDTLNNEKADRILKAQRIPLRFGKDDADAFERVFDVVTEVNRVNIWHAAHRWYENSKQKGGRFARLDIVETVIPDVTKKYEKTEFPIDVKLGKEGEKKGLLDAIKEEKGDLYLIGQGGIGKTTALMKIMENAYKEPYTGDTQIPVFIELSFAPDSDGEGKVYENGRSTFIKRSVYKQISDRRSQDQGAYDGAEEVAGVFGLDPDIAVKPIRDLFTKESPSPEYLLLLDGLNEVSDARIKNGSDTVASLVVGEIKEIIEKCPNVRVILTSRTDETAIPFDGVRRLYLEGVSDGNTEKYLSEKKIPQKEIARIKKDASLWETLHIPLFLTIYADLTEREGISTQGEILRCFFHERRRNIYTQQQRIAEVGTNFYSSEGAVEAHLNSDMLNFIIDLIIPELAYEMEKNGEFYVSRKQIRDTLAAVLESRGDSDVLGVYGDDVFQITLRGGGRTAPSEIADDIIRIFGKNFNKTAENAVHALVYSLGIMQKTDNRYGFLHQHFRDYFAAVRYLNTVKLASAIFEDGDGKAALSVSNEAFCALPLKIQIRRFIGEIAGEHHNKPYCENKTWGLPEKAGDSLIMKALDIYRGVGHKVAGYAVYSLVHILNEARGELSGCDLSRLDFSECNLNGMRLSRKNLPAVFKGAVLHGKNLNYEGHTSIINSIFYSPDGKRILTSSGDGTAKIWDASTLQVLGTLKRHEIDVYSASYSPDGKRIVTASDDNTANVWDANSFDMIRSFEGCEQSISSISYSPDGKRIVAASGDKTIMIWDAESFELLATYKGNTENVISILYNPDGTRIIINSNHNTSKVFDTASFEPIGELDGYSNNYSPDGKRIVTVSWDHTVKVWDAESFELIGILKGNRAAYSPDGKFIITASDYNTVKIWETENYELIVTLEGELAEYCPDNTRIVAVTGNSIKIYETENYFLV